MEHLPALSKKQSLPETVQLKASDYIRLFDVKCSYWSKQMPPQCLTMVCLELAAKSLSIPFDKSKNHKLAGVTKSSYGAAFQLVERTLQLQPHAAVKDHAVLFGVPEVIDLAEGILRAYREKMSVNVGSDAVDLQAAMYPLAALYTACKHEKVRVDQNRFVSSAGIGRPLFHSILVAMQPCVPKMTTETTVAEEQNKQPKSASKVNMSKKKPAAAPGTTTPAAKRHRCQDTLDKVLHSPMSGEFVQWKIDTMAEARKSASSRR